MRSSDPALFDSFAAEYDGAAQVERDHRFFWKHFPDARNLVLDLGCGTGLLAAELARCFDRVVGVDVSQPMLEIARQLRTGNNISYIQADIARLPDLGKFDCIVSHTAFHHLTDLPPVLVHLRQILNPQGKIIILDCVARLPVWMLRWAICYHLLATAQFIADLTRRTPAEARILFQFRTDSRWIAHRQKDRYFTRVMFREVYPRLLPSAAFFDFNSFMAVVWTAPARYPRAEGSVLQSSERLYSTPDS